MLTQEQLKDYRDQLAQHFAKGKEQIDSRGVIGALLTALGMERSRVIPDAVGRLKFELDDAKKTWSGALPKPGQIKPFDIMLKTRAGVGELEPANLDWRRLGMDDSPKSRIYRKLYEMVAGKRDNHAYIVLPYERVVDGKKTMELIPTVIANNEKGAITAAHPRLAAAAKAIQHRSVQNAGGFLPRINKFLDRYKRNLNLFEQEAARRTPYSSWNEMIEKTYGGVPPENALNDFLDETGTSRFLRFKEELTPDEIVKVRERIMKAQTGTFLDEDNTISAAKNFLFGPGKTTKFNPEAKIPTCSGGVCHVFEGIRDMPSVSRGLPQDIARQSSLREVGNFFHGKSSPSRAGRIRWVPGVEDPTVGRAFQEVELYPEFRQTQSMVSKNSIRAARRALTARFGMAAVPLGLGGYMMGSSPTVQRMVNPLAEQSKLIGQKVKDYVTQARNRNAGNPA